MKKIFTLLVVSMALTAFNTKLIDVNKNIVGNWKFSEKSYPAIRKMIVETTRKSSPEMADQIEAMGEQLNELFPMLTFSYNADGTYEFTTPQGPQTGKWKINGNFLERISNEDPGGAVRKDSIISIEPKVMTLYNLEIKEAISYNKE